MSAKFPRGGAGPFLARSLHCVGVLSSADFFSKSTFTKNYFRNMIRVSNSLDPDQARPFVEPDLGPNFCKSYLQTTLGDKELSVWFSSLPYLFLATFCRA